MFGDKEGPPQTPSDIDARSESTNTHKAESKLHKGDRLGESTGSSGHRVTEGSDASFDSNGKHRRGKSKIFAFPAPEETVVDIMKKERCWPLFVTIVTYLINELGKKQRSFQIGVFTVFIVVAFLTLLKSVVDVAPIAFVKVAQDQSGMSDFTLVPNFDSP